MTERVQTQPATVIPEPAAASATDAAAFPFAAGLTTEHVLAMQRTAGNRSVTRFLAARPLARTPGAGVMGAVGLDELVAAAREFGAAAESAAVGLRNWVAAEARAAVAGVGATATGAVVAATAVVGAIITYTPDQGYFIETPDGVVRARLTPSGQLVPIANSGPSAPPPTRRPPASGGPQPPSERPPPPDLGPSIGALALVYQTVAGRQRGTAGHAAARGHDHGGPAILPPATPPAPSREPHAPAPASMPAGDGHPVSMPGPAGAPRHVPGQRSEPLHAAARYVPVPADLTHLRELARQMRAALPPRKRNSTTVAVGLVQDGENLFLVYSVNQNDNRPPLQSAAAALQLTYWGATPRVEPPQSVNAQGRRRPVSGRGEHGSPTDAEQLMIEAALANDMRIIAIAPSRPACSDCVPALAAERIIVVAP